MLRPSSLRQLSRAASSLVARRQPRGHGRAVATSFQNHRMLSTKGEAPPPPQDEDAFPLDDLFKEGELEDSTGAIRDEDLDLKLQQTASNDAETFGGLLDPEAPPKLNERHYEMLKGIDFSGRKERHRELNKEQLQRWTQRVASVRQLTKKQFGFDPEELMQLKSFQPPTADDFGAGVFKHQQAPADPLLEMQKEVTFQKEKLPREDPVYGFDPKIAGSLWASPASYGLLERQVPMSLNLKQKGVCIFRDLPDPSREQVKEIKYSNIQLLSRFINERGMLKSRKLTFVSAKYQRKLAKAVKQARFIGLLDHGSNFHVPATFANIEEARANNAVTAFDPKAYHANRGKAKGKKEKAATTMGFDDASFTQEIVGKQPAGAQGDAWVDLQ